MRNIDEIPTIHDIMNGKVIEIINKINNKKEALFLEALNKKTGLNFDIKGIEEEAKRMFPRIKKTISNDGFIETYFWDDLTENGMRIITFCLENKMNKDNFGFTQNLSWS